MLCLVLASTTVLVSGLAIYYYTSYVVLEKRYDDTVSTLNAATYVVKILVKYDNGTKVWYNQTRIPIGWSLLQATNRTTGWKVLGQKFAFGTFVISINGVPGKGPAYWIAYSWDGRKWTSINVGSDQYLLREGEIVAWYLTEDWAKTP